VLQALACRTPVCLSAKPGAAHAYFIQVHNGRFLSMVCKTELWLTMRMRVGYGAVMPNQH
jgi:hypothetical protein